MSKLLNIIAATQDDLNGYLAVAAKFHAGSAAALTKAAELFTNLAKASQTTQAFYDAIVTKAQAGPEQDLAKAQSALFKSSFDGQSGLAAIFTDLSKASTELGEMCKAASEYCDDDDEDEDDDEPESKSAKAAKSSLKKAAADAAGAGAGAGDGAGAAATSELTKTLASISEALTKQTEAITGLSTRVSAVEKSATTPPAAVNGAAGAGAAGAGAGDGTGAASDAVKKNADGTPIERKHEDTLAKGAQVKSTGAEDDTGL